MNATQLAAARRAELEALVATNGGGITPAAVVEFARDNATALHSLFTWDDTEAARRFRELQAAQYIRAVVKLIPRGGDLSPLRVRAFVQLQEEHGDSVYRPVVDVVSQAAGRHALLEQAMRELQAFRKKYEDLQELSQLYAVIDQTLQPVAA